MIFLTAQDFESGKHKIAQDCWSVTEIQSCIDKFEEIILQDLLGCELFELFKADLVAGVPQTQRFVDIFNKFCKDDDCGIIRSCGMVEMLKGFIFFFYVNEQKFQNTMAGTVKSNIENSQHVSNWVFGLAEHYNEGIESFKAIQHCICEDSTLYPEYNGQKKDSINSFGF